MSNGRKWRESQIGILYKYSEVSEGTVRTVVFASLVTVMPKRVEVKSQSEKVASLSTGVFNATKVIVKLRSQCCHSVSVGDMVDRLRCPITYVLPIDPVTAEDGQFYERLAIVEWAKRQEGPRLKSPMTNLLIGTKITRAFHITQSIYELAKTTEYDCDELREWKRSYAQRVKYIQTLKSAKLGDVESMCKMGFYYREGTPCVYKRDVSSVWWFKKASELKNVAATTALGLAYINGLGIARNVTRGISLITIAATMGSEHACGVLAWANQRGHHGFDKDTGEATKWYKLMKLATTCRDATATSRVRCDAWLRDNPPDVEVSISVCPCAGPCACV